MTVTKKNAGGILAAVFMFLAASGAVTLYLPEKISPGAYRASLQALESYRRAYPQEDVRMLAVVDYSKPSYLKRMALINMNTGEQTFYRVAHGKRSGTMYARHFSDIPESNMSSLGLYKVLSMYHGDHGTALRLEGLEPGRNGNAYRRDIVLHSAEYVSLHYIFLNLVTLEGPRIGRSNGCFVVPAGEIEEVAQRLGRGGFIYAWAADEIEMD